MLQSALIQNVQTRPDVFGARQFAPLPSQKVPLYTLPPIVGDTMYTPGQGESIGTQFFRDKMSPVRTFGSASLQGRTPIVGRMDMDKYHQIGSGMEDQMPMFGGRQNQIRPAVMPNMISRRQQLGLGEPNGNSSQR
jgi:hypothetical protein